MVELTPVEYHDALGIWAKRDDLYARGGVRGGKVRTCWALATAQPVRGLVTAGSRHSPQVNIVAHVARELGVPCRLHTPTGPAGPEVQAAIDAGGTRVEHRAGYNSVIKARAREDAERRGWCHIPFGMECEEAVRQTAWQVQNLPWSHFNRIVVAVGSGMSTAGILQGLADVGRLGHAPIAAFYVGADPRTRLRRWAPFGWECYTELRQVPTGYALPATANRWDGVVLDPHYEAKVMHYLTPGDLFWVVGCRQTV